MGSADNRKKTHKAYHAKQEKKEQPVMTGLQYYGEKAAGWNGTKVHAVDQGLNPTAYTGNYVFSTLGERAA